MTIRVLMVLFACLGLNARAAGEPAVPATEKDLIKAFGNPPAVYRGKPFWSWNGKLEKDELIRQARIMKAMGFGGYFMHSRVGLKTEYLGDDWFSLINAVADESEKLGMEAWLYDEDRWPSGSAGGLVTQEPRYRLKYVQLDMLKPAEFRWDDQALAAFACKLEGINYSNARRLTRETAGQVAVGETVLLFTLEPMRPHPFYNGNTYLDSMDIDATRRYIELTHEQYRKRCGDRLGRSIKGIFTDEPHRGMLMSSFGEGREHPERCIPWSTHFAESFQARFGYDPVERLPEIFLRREGQRLSPVKWQYLEHAQTLFLQNFMKPIQEWCHTNKMQFTGHVLHEDNLVAQIVPNGSMLRNYEFMDAPGVDVLTEGNRNYWVVKQVMSVARQMGKKQVLSELYGCTGWQMDFEAYKAAGDWQGLFGVNMRCPHLSWYTLQGETKRDYPGSILHQMSAWPQWNHLETYFARLNVVLERGKPACDLLVIDPVESVWAQIGLGWCNGLSAGTPEIQRLEQSYQDTFHGLANAQLDFDYGAEDHLARFGSVETVTGRPVLRLGAMDYRVVLVSGMETLRGTTAALLEKFAKAGGKIVFAGTVPGFVDAAASDRLQTLAKTVTQCPADALSMIGSLRPLLPATVTVTGAGSQTNQPDRVRNVFCQARREGAVIWAVVMNVDTQKGQRDLAVRMEGSGSVEEWNLITGERTLVPSVQRAGCVEVNVELPPSGSRCFRVVPKAGKGVLPAPEWSELARLPVQGPFAYTIDEPNVCLLDRARWRLDNGEWKGDTEILRVDREVRDRFKLPQRGGEMVQPWYAAKHLPVPTVQGALELAFDFEIQDMPAGTVELIMETPEKFTVELNGRPLTPAAGAKAFWIDSALRRVPIPAGTLKPGMNTVTLKNAFRSDVDLESLYLLGSFGVKLDGTRRTLVKLPETLATGSITTQGLPFYGAGVTYRVPVPTECRAGGVVFVQTPKFSASCITVGKSAGSQRMIAWQPYEVDVSDLCKSRETLDLHVVVTRRNTFGPVHELPLKQGAYHPGSFHSGGPNWSEGYAVYPAGLLDAPVFIRRTQTRPPRP
ncbi:MAG: hypothetical protein WCK89_16885 [bacterium]